jgi:hypothetical protein
MGYTLQIPLLLFDPALACDALVSYCLYGCLLYFLSVKQSTPTAKQRNDRAKYCFCCYHY